MKAALLAVVALAAAGSVFYLAGAGSASPAANGLAKMGGARITPNVLTSFFADGMEQLPGHPALSRKSFSLPLFFEPNQGQTDGRVKFLARGAGYGLFLTADEAVLELARAPHDQKRLASSSSASQRAASVIRMRIEGAKSGARIRGTQPLVGKTNYFLGNNPSRWRRDIPQFGAVEYEGVYPGIDLVYYGNQKQLEYDFRVAPGAAPEQIALSFRGASARLESGDLVLATAGGDVRFRAPHIYQKDASGEKEIGGGFRQLADDKIGFHVGPYDHSRELIIDPVLSYSTFLGEGTESLVNVAIDSADNVYLAGSTMSAGFPVTAGALQTTLAGPQNLFIAVLNPLAASQLLYLTYLGGNGTDDLAGIGVDPGSGVSFPNINIYVAGTTTSTNFPTTTSTAFQPTAVFGTNQTHGFLSVINVAPGTTNTFTLKYSTYLAGNASNGNTTENDVVTGLAVDSSFNAYVTGTTTSTDVITGFPSTPNAFQICPFQVAQSGGTPCPVTTGPTQFFASKVNTNGSGAASMLYSTYFGGGYTNGPQVIQGGGIAVDPSSSNSNSSNVNMYFTGSTNMPGGTGPNNAAGFPLFTTLQSCLDQSGQTTNCTTGLTAPDAFIAKINPSLNQPNAPPVYSTYLGGSGNDAGLGVAVDTLGDAYVTGSTTSSDWVCTTANACQIGPFTYANGSGATGVTNAFVAKVDSGGFAMAFFTYIGGSTGPDVGQAVAVDSVQNVHVVGSAMSADLPITPTGTPNNYIQPYQGNGDAFVGLLSTTLPNGTGGTPPAGDYLTYLGGSALDQGTGIAVDVNGNGATYVAGTTQSANFPVKNPLQGSLTGAQNAFLSVLGNNSNLMTSQATSSPSPNPLPAGTQGTFTFNIANNGPDPASNVLFEAIVPTSGLASLPTATVSGAGTCSSAVGQTIVCTIGTLAVNAVEQVEVFVTPQSPAVGLNPALGVSGKASANGGPFGEAVGQSVPITDFAITAQPGSQTVQNGGLATYNVSLAADYPEGYNATVTMSQSSSPAIVASPAPTFTITPVTISGTTAATTQLNIQTVARPVTTGSLFPHGSFYAAWLPIGGLSLLGLGIGARTRRRRWLTGALLGVVAGLALLLPSCGSSSTPTTTTGGTAAGQYTITITGTASTGASHNYVVTLNVT